MVTYGPSKGSAFQPYISTALDSTSGSEHRGPTKAITPHHSLLGLTTNCYTQYSHIVLHILKLKLFEISKFWNVLMAIFKCSFFRVFHHLSGVKNELLFWYVCTKLRMFKVMWTKINLLQNIRTCKLQNIFITCWYGQNFVLWL